ncbi:peptidase inhibitor family I36 protein [Nonomuraea sp. NPDC050643]|uniref:peptidase inhibitor family I36 protein n=1 Tax=Nonomuraea sp. NPDC050643 TaxID=3155660 RepID=UPI0033DD3C5B
MVFIKRALVAGILAGGALIAGTASSANAACTDQVCVYEGRGGGGTVAGFTTADNNFSNNRFQDGSGVNDRISSISATSGCDPIFYTDSFWRGDSQTVWSDGRTYNAVYDNRYSSFRFSLTSCH